jgi:hypothetical protein
MNRPAFVRFLRLKGATPLVLSGLLAAIVICLFTSPSNFKAHSFVNTAFAEEPQHESIDGAWHLSLPMPGGAKKSTLVLTSRGDSISGTMSSPGDPTDVHPFHDGELQNSSFSLSADIGRITYFLEGTYGGQTLSFDMQTTETIPLGDGNRLSGNPDEISGSYLVPVYSPGGIMENHFEFTAENGMITGQMYVPVTGNETSRNQMAGAPPGMQAPPGGLPAGAPASGGPGEAGGDKRDVNTFFDGTHEGNRISLFTRTAQGSLFHFTGTVEGNVIRLDMHVTDQRKGLEAVRVE